LVVNLFDVGLGVLGGLDPFLDFVQEVGSGKFDKGEHGGQGKEGKLYGGQLGSLGGPAETGT